MSYPKNICDRCRGTQGFTLIEVMFVVVLASLLAVVSIVRFSGPYQRARFECNCNLIKDMESTARLRACRTRQPQVLEIDLESNQIAIRNAGAADAQQTTLAPQGTHLAEFRTMQRSLTSGAVSLAISGHGISATYALLLTSGPKRRWILFLGGTGQTVETESDEEISKIFRWQQMQGADAH